MVRKFVFKLHKIDWENFCTKAKMKLMIQNKFGKRVTQIQISRHEGPICIQDRKQEQEIGRLGLYYLYTTRKAIKWNVIIIEV